MSEILKIIKMEGQCLTHNVLDNLSENSPKSSQRDIFEASCIFACSALFMDQTQSGNFNPENTFRKLQKERQ